MSLPEEPFELVRVAQRLYLAFLVGPKRSELAREQKLSPIEFLALLFRAVGSASELMHKVTSCDLLILDDFGLRPLTAQAADGLYEIIHCRYERSSIS